MSKVGKFAVDNFIVVGEVAVFIGNDHGIKVSGYGSGFYHELYSTSGGVQSLFNRH